MELTADTRDKLRDMGASDLLDALEAQDEALCMGMTCAERVQMAVDEAHSAFVTSKVRNLTKRAGLRYPEADVRSIDFSEERGLDRLLITELATCGFAERGQNVVILGPAGTGKTYLVCALAKAACQRRMRACYVRAPDLEDLWRESRERPGGERKLVRKYVCLVKSNFRLGTSVGILDQSGTGGEPHVQPGAEEARDRDLHQIRP